ncbi:MAG: hypothetical protein KKD31_15670, partial [Bacteroidetes bacterium]|nr:hypothetical protein [Bacteroidota bacterium]
SFHLFRTKADAMLESITGNHARNFRLSEAAIRRLMELSLSDENLHTVLSEAVILTETLYWGSKNGEILISDDHLPQRYHTVTAKSATEIREMGETRLTKTIRLLDRLEEASLKVLENQQNLTGKNVGAFCSTPISAPAISDALRNHRMKIEELFSIYPDQWYLLRKHFKPIRNILTGKYSDLKNTG